MQPRLKIWVEAGDGLVLSDYRVRLLELVAETGSLSEAAERMGLSYRRAWGKLKEIEANLGLKLIESTVGGSGGGHTRLTPKGAEMVARYNRFRSRVSAFVETEFAACFAAEPAAPSV
ncbi:MAG TPA: LysR family transcriptional regulator [Dehalococcoidia bacterium]|nr:LysR family transcriptional regulator [Dehalococcoidia bacterium]